MTEKEIELNGWIVNRLRKCAKSPVEWCYVTMDADGGVYATKEMPHRCEIWALWTGASGYMKLGCLPVELRIWPWKEFLLKFSPLPLVAPIPLNLLFLEDEAGETPAIWSERIANSNLTPDPRPLTPAFEREIWTASVMGQAMRLRVAVVEEALPSPLERAHWRLPTDEELDLELPGGWTDICPVEI